MGEGVVRERVAFGEFAPHEFGQVLDFAADQKERRAHAFLRERVEHLRRGFRVGAVVEGEDDFVVGEWDRLVVGLQADLQPAFGADADDARGAEFVRAALGGRGGADAEQHDQGGDV